MSSTRWSTGTRRHKHENVKSHQHWDTLKHTRLQNTVHKSQTHARARVLSLFDFNSVFQDDIAFSRNHAACTSNKQTHTNPTAAPLPLTRCAVLRHKREPSSVATTTFYSRAWVLRGRLIIVARLIPFFFTKSFARKERNHKTAAIDFEFFKRLMFLLWLRTVTFVRLWLIRTGSKTKWQTSDRRTQSTGSYFNIPRLARAYLKQP